MLDVRAFILSSCSLATVDEMELDSGETNLFEASDSEADASDTAVDWGVEDGANAFFKLLPLRAFSVISSACFSASKLL